MHGGGSETRTRPPLCRPASATLDGRFGSAAGSGEGCLIDHGTLGCRSSSKGSQSPAASTTRRPDGRRGRWPQTPSYLGIRVLCKFAGGLLEGSNGDPIPLTEKAQMRITAQGSLMAEFRTRDRARRHDPLDPKAPSPVATAGSEATRGGARRERPLRHRSERAGIALPCHPQPVVEVALRPEVLWRNQHAPAGPECGRERDSSIGRVAVKCDIDPARSAKQRKPC